MSITTFPKDIISGDSLNIIYTDSEINPNNGYSLLVQISGSSSKTIAANVANNTFVVALSSAQNDFKEGVYTVAVASIKANNRTTLFTQTLNVLEDPWLTTKKDRRTFNMKMLDSVEALMQRRATSQQLDLIRTKIKDRELEALSHEDLMKLHDRYKTRVLQEQGKLPKYVQYYFEAR
jgi:hypothetical protein